MDRERSRRGKDEEGRGVYDRMRGGRREGERSKGGGRRGRLEGGEGGFGASINEKDPI